MLVSSWSAVMHTTRWPQSPIVHAAGSFAIACPLRVTAARLRGGNVNANQRDLRGVSTSLESFERSCATRTELLEQEADALTSAQLDELVDRATSTSVERLALPLWAGSPAWLWQQWQGTVFESGWPRAMASVLVSFALVCMTRLMTPAGQRWPLWAPPDPAHPFILRLKAVDQGWTLLLTLTSFVTTFFLGQACYLLLVLGSLARAALLLAAACCLLLPHYSLLTTHYSPLTTHHSPLTTHHSPLTTHHSLLTTHCLLLTAYC